MKAKKQSNLKIVDKTARAEEEQRHDRRAAEERPWLDADKKARISSSELHQRVIRLRAELEAYQKQLDAVPFDLPDGETPACLDYASRKYHHQLLEGLNPKLESTFDMIDNFAKDHGCHEHLDFNAKFFEFKMRLAATGFQVGLLAGVIFASCPKDIVDRFERGLEYSLRTDNAGVLHDHSR